MKLCMKEHFQIVVVGGGHAGIEAASAAARMGCTVALLTMDLEAIGRLSCNPAIGGMAKGQLTREIDALGGEMGLLADRAGIQFKMLGLSKGPAMWSPRAQCDKDLYPRLARERLKSIPGLRLIQGLVENIWLNEGIVSSVHLSDGRSISCETVILCSGTFLCSRMHSGESQSIGGRIGEASVEYLSGTLRNVGFHTGRLKTGTPPRIDRRSVDFSRCQIDSGDESPRPFSWRTSSVVNQIDCYLTATTTTTHEVLRTGFDRSPMFTGRITGIGPRYCPSIEDKIFRFAEKESHQIFLEPEGIDTDSIYVNGFSSSLPEEVQLAGLRSIPGLEECNVLRYGYAVEYDYFPPHQLNLSLESKLVGGLFFAGQVNGTSGYEEAAAQGLIAGINAALKVTSRAPFILDRAQAYIGVLIDDLVNLSTNEPYRMFTSRAEYRLLLRQDNADLRLSELGYELGLVDFTEITRVRTKKESYQQAEELLKKKGPTVEDLTELGLEGGPGMKWWQLLKRPDLDIAFITSSLPDDLQALVEDREVAQQIDIAAIYEGYIQRQIEEVARFREQERVAIPADIDYDRIRSLSSEGREKLSRIRPASLGQASRISGVSRSDLSVLMLYIR